jgi:hypothetical protein
MLHGNADARCIIETVLQSYQMDKLNNPFYY